MTVTYRRRAGKPREQDHDAAPRRPQGGPPRPGSSPPRTPRPGEPQPTPPQDEPPQPEPPQDEAPQPEPFRSDPSEPGARATGAKPPGPHPPGPHPPGPHPPGPHARSPQQPGPQQPGPPGDSPPAHRRETGAVKPGHECASCRTRTTVHVEESEAVVVRVDGTTCAQCNERQKASPPTAGRSRVTVMVAQPPGEPPRIEALHENLADKSATYLPPRVVADPLRTPAGAESKQRNREWQEAVDPAVAKVLPDAADRLLVRESWQPGDCETLEAVADVLDDVWRTVVPAGAYTEVVLRIVGFHPTVAAILLVTVERVVRGGETPGAGIGETLRYSGIAICAETGTITVCRSFRHELAGEGGVDTVFARLEGSWARAITATSTDLTLGEFLHGLGPTAEKVPVSRAPEPERTAGPLSASIFTTTAGLDGPSSTATFGEP